MKFAISVGDINGVGLEILLKNHKKISKLCTPIYCIDKSLLQKAAKLLCLKMPKDILCISPNVEIPKITPAQITPQSGAYSYASYL